MQISYSELIVLNNEVLDNVKTLISCGSKKIELMMDAAGWDKYKGDYKELIPALKAFDVQYSVHPAAWDINLTAEMEILRDSALQHHLQALQFCAELGASQMVVHPGFSNSPCFSKETAKKRAKAALKIINEAAKKYPVKLAWENVGYNGSSIYTFDEYIHSLDDMDENVGYLVDVGHANVNGWSIPKLVDSVSDRLFGMHLHDNNGKSDQHRPIHDGTIDWDKTLESMQRIKNPNCEFILEYVPGTPLEALAKGKAIVEGALN